jgi:2-polyprenyl-6-hydroxyphenyl methylase / 3-demethylubiquinone-9 3-methyltransferase
LVSGRRARSVPTDKDAGVARATLPTRPRNDPQQYEDLAGAWWDPTGPFAMLHWIAEARAGLVPPATRQRALLVDLGCGGGLLAPHLRGKGYAHLGFDLSLSALAQARDHGAVVTRSDVGAVPLANAVADVVVAGEILEHVTDLDGVLAEACRILRPGGTLVIDTIANTVLARFVVVTVAERIPRGAPKGIHDGRLFVDRRRLVSVCAAHGVDVELTGLRPTVGAIMGRSGRAGRAATMRPTFSTAILFQGLGKKRS